MATPASGVSPWRKQLPKLGVILLVAMSLYMLISAFLGADTSITTTYPKGIDSVAPIPKAQTVPSQSSITVDLSFGYTGDLYVNGKFIPQDQQNRSAIGQTGVFIFTPAENTEFRLLPGSVVSAKVVFWPVKGTEEKDAQVFEWKFSVS
jgi:hypothetical protein